MFWCVSFCISAFLGWKRWADLAFEKQGIFFFYDACSGEQGAVGVSCLKLKHLIKATNPNAESKCFLFPLILCFFSLFRVFWASSHFTSIPWLLPLCHTVPSVGATPQPSACSHYCRLSTWHSLNPACSSHLLRQPVLGASFGLFYPFSVAQFQLDPKRGRRGGREKLQNFVQLLYDWIKPAYIAICAMMWLLPSV